MESKNQTAEQEQKVDYDNLEQYTKRELINICTDLNLTVNKKKNKGFIISKIQAQIKGFCETLDCSEKAVVSNSNGQRVCLEHQTGRKYCSHEGCKKIPKYGLEGQKALYCVTHKQPDMIDVKSKTCLHEGCTKQPKYGFQGQKALYCVSHKQADMVDVLNKTCLHEGCKTRPQYGLEGQKAIYCSAHKQSDMVDVVNKSCLHEGCTKIPHYGLEGQKPLYCVAHKQADMVDVVNKTCLHEGCKTRPQYGFDGQKALYCSAHKQPDMVDVVSKTCLYEGCKKIPSFGLEGQKALYCSAHKQPDMVDVENKTCLHEGCKKQPFYGLEGQKALYCSAHKQPDMLNVVSKTCLQEACQTKNPKFGTHLTGRIHCVKHYNKKTEWKLTNCKSSKCRRISTHSETGNYPYEFCDDHCPKNYLSNLTSSCNNCNLTELICDEDGRCLLSCSLIHKKRFKFSETEMNKFLTTNNLEFTSDKIEDSSCSKNRADFVFRTPYGVVIVENDENQHRTYLSECEQTRMIQIHQDFGESVHFIRFNPDRYRSESENLRLEQRHKILLTKVLRPILNQPENFFIRNQGLTVRYMYYDNCDGQFSVQSINY